MLLRLGSNFYDFTFDQIFGESNYLSRDKKVWEMREKAVNRAFVLQVSTIVMCLLSAVVHALTHIFKLNFSTVSTDEMHGKLSTAVSCYWCCDVISFFDTIDGSLNCLLHLLMPAPTFSFFAFPFLYPPTPPPTPLRFLYSMLVRQGQTMELWLWLDMPKGKKGSRTLFQWTALPLSSKWVHHSDLAGTR